MLSASDKKALSRESKQVFQRSGPFLSAIQPRHWPTFTRCAPRSMWAFSCRGLSQCVYVHFIEGLADFPPLTRTLTPSKKSRCHWLGVLFEFVPSSLV